MKVQFDPDEVFSLGEAGTVYPSLRIVDEWGILTVTNSALIDKNWSGVQVAVGRDLSEPPLRGEGWTLQLNEGWKSKPGTRPGDWVLTRR
jgi:hypothetical protein